MLRALRDAFKIPDLRKRLLFTMAILAIYRLGAIMPVPGVSLEGLDKIFEGGILGMLDLFSGGALSNFAVFSLGIMPYITSTIILQLLQIIFPGLEKIAKEGEAGRRKINQIARYITVGLAIFQSIAMFFYFRNIEAIKGDIWPMLLVVVITLTAGTSLIMWLGELITQRGIGNGMSIIIFVNIISRFPGYIINSFNKWWPAEIHILAIVLLIALAVIVFIIIVQQGERKIQVQYAKQIRGRRVYGGRGTYIPIKVNQAGVIPVIFASSLLAFPATIAQFIQVPWVQKFAQVIGPPIEAGETKPWYLILYAMLILGFTYFYAAIAFNPEDIADNFRKYGGFIPGIRPGKPTVNFLNKILNRVNLPGAIFLAIIALLPTAFYNFFNAPFRFGGTSILIAVGVALEFMKQLEAQLIMRNYEGFLK
jgi:preprotein translocase subunit SecY